MPEAILYDQTRCIGAQKQSFRNVLSIILCPISTYKNHVSNAECPRRHDLRNTSSDLGRSMRDFWLIL